MTMIYFRSLKLVFNPQIKLSITIKESNKLKIQLSKFHSEINRSSTMTTISTISRPLIPIRWTTRITLSLKDRLWKPNDF